MFQEMYPKKVLKDQLNIYPSRTRCTDGTRSKFDVESSFLHDTTVPTIVWSTDLGKRTLIHQCLHRNLSTTRNFTTLIFDDNDFKGFYYILPQYSFFLK